MKNIEINYMNGNGYEALYPQTDYRCVIDLLSDSTKSLMGLGVDGTPDDAFRQLFFSTVLGDKCAFKLVIKSNSSGTPMPNIPIECSSYIDVNGNPVASPLYTDSNGEINTYFRNGNVTLSVAGFADIQDISQQYTVVNGKQYEYEWSLTTINFVKFTTSGRTKLSSNISSLDVTVVGGGGGGNAGGYGRDVVNGGAGGGGGYCTVKTFSEGEFSVNTPLSYVVGSGGSGTWWDSDADRINGGSNGGASSFLEVNAQGGNEGYRGGTGNGNGGAGAVQYSPPHNGVQGTVLGWDSFSQQVYFGGGGGGGDYNGLHGGGLGAGYGGDGGSTAQDRAENGTNDYGGGGGGGSSGTGSSRQSDGADGGSGVVTIRMHLKIT